MSWHGSFARNLFIPYRKFASLKNLSNFRSTLLQNPEEYDIIILGRRLSGCIGSASNTSMQVCHIRCMAGRLFYVLLLYREKGNLSSEMKKFLLIQSQIWSIFLKTSDKTVRSNDKEKSQSQKVGSGIFIVQYKKRTC